MTLVAGIDSGTKACKVIVRDMATGRLIRTGAAAHPQDATVAQRWTSLHAAVTAAGGAEDVSAIAITGAPTSAIALDDHARPIATLVGDARTAAFLITGVGAAVFAQRTGAVPSADTALSGLRRLHETDHDTAARVASVVTTTDWLSWRLRGGEEGVRGALESFVTDRSQASSTGFYDIVRGTYDSELVRIGLGRVVHTPTVLHSAQRAGVTSDGMVVAAGLSADAAVALGMALRTGDIVMNLQTTSTLTALNEKPVHDPSGAIVCRCDADQDFLVFATTGDALAAISDLEQLMGGSPDLLAQLASGADQTAGGLRYDGDALRGIGSGGFTAPNVTRAILEGVLRDQWRSVAPLAAHGVVTRRAVLRGRYSRLLADVAPAVLPMPVEVTVESEFAADGAAVQAAWALQGSRPGWVPASALHSHVVG